MTEQHAEGLGLRRDKLIEAIARAERRRALKAAYGSDFISEAQLDESISGSWEMIRFAVDDLLTTIAEQGYAVVPREPTEAMQREGFRNNRHVNPEPCDKPTCVGAVTMPADRAYRAMIAVADLASPKNGGPTSA